MLLVETVILRLLQLPFILISRFSKKILCNSRLYFFRQISRKIPDSASKRHTYISGGTGAGKSELLGWLIYYYQSRKNATVVLIDPHGDLSEQVVRLKSNLKNEKLVYIFSGLSQNKLPIINPFYRFHAPDETYIDLMSRTLLSVFKEIIEDTQFSQQMEVLLAPCIAVALRLGNADLYTLQRFMNDNMNQDLVEIGMRSPVFSQQEFFKNKFHLSNFSRTKFAIYTRIQSLLNSKILSDVLLGNSTIDLEKELNSNKLIVFNLSQMGEEMSSIYGRFVIGLIRGVVSQRALIHPSKRVPIFLFVDEVQNFFSPSIKRILNESRKYGLHLTMANQFISDMSKNLRQAVLANTKVKITGLGSHDTYHAIYKETQTPLEELQKIRSCQFSVSTWNRVGVPLSTPNTLKKKRCLMQATEWKKLRKQQIERYYREVQHLQYDQGVSLQMISSQELQTKKDSNLSTKSLERSLPKFNLNG